MNKVFVYGTLKSGFSNHSRLKGSKFIKECSTSSDYTMYSVNGWYPAVVEQGNTSIKGELYLVSDEVLFNSLDILEGYNKDNNTGMYLRKKIEIEEEQVYTYIYNYPLKGLNIIENGKW